MGTLPPAPVSPGYKAGVVVVAFLMVLLPVVYLALIGGVGWGVVQILSMAGDGLEEGSGKGTTLLVALIYALPGFILIFFLVKPLFARMPERAGRRPLQRRDHPLFFEFIDRLCRVVGAPVPDRIEVDTMINASAGMHLGLVSVERGQLVLTVGLPLIAGLSVRQLAGVLSHEFGHFTQGGAMRLSRTISIVNGWFARVVYQRDVWDERIKLWTANSPHRAILAFFLLTQLLIAVSRGVLWCLMWLAHAFSCYLTRQMEFAADVYEARLAGGETFARSCLRIRVLEFASGQAGQDLAAAWTDGRLADDLPALVAFRADEIPDTDVREIRKAMLDVETGIFDTHPSDKDRIERARREGAGLYRVEGRATELFRDFPALCRETTLTFYRETFGDRFRPQGLLATSDLIEKQREREAKTEVRDRFFQGVPTTGSRLLFLGVSELPASAPDVVARLEALRATLVAGAAKARAAHEKLEDAFEGRILLAQAKGLSKATVRYSAKDYRLDSKSQADMAEALQTIERTESYARRVVDPLETVAQERMLLALSALDDPGVAARAGGEAARNEVRDLVKTLQSLRSVRPAIFDAHERMAVLEAIMANAKKAISSDPLDKEIRAAIEALPRSLDMADRNLQSEPYPYPHATGQLTLGQFLLPLRHPGATPPHPDAPDPKSPNGLASTAEVLCERYFELHERIVDDLANRAEAVETALGLPPLPAMSGSAT